MRDRGIRDKAHGILEDAKKYGVDKNSFFETTYHLLSVQIDMLEKLEQAFNEDGPTITKEYVKGRENVYCHPAVDKYTKVSDSAMNKIEKIKQLVDSAKSEKKIEDGFESFGDDAE